MRVVNSSTRQDQQLVYCQHSKPSYHFQVVLIFVPRSPELLNLLLCYPRHIPQFAGGGKNDKNGSNGGEREREIDREKDAVKTSPPSSEVSQTLHKYVQIPVADCK